MFQTELVTEIFPIFSSIFHDSRSGKSVLFCLLWLNGHLKLDFRRVSSSGIK